MKKPVRLHFFCGLTGFWKSLSWLTYYVSQLTSLCADHKSFFSGLGLRKGLIRIAENAVADSDIVFGKPPFLQKRLPFLRLIGSRARWIQQESTPREKAAFIRFPITRLPSSTQVPRLRSARTTTTVALRRRDPRRFP